MLRLSHTVLGAMYRAVLALVWSTSVRALDNGLALTPPMGFNTWARYKCTVDCERCPETCINEDLIVKIANEMKSGGYFDAGYEYLVIDDCWMSQSRNIWGDLQEDRWRFPNGMKNLIKYVQSLGLKFGIYENYGKTTCMGYPGTFGDSIKRDVRLFSKWEVDFVKLDGCFTPLDQNCNGYPEFGKHLNQTGRPIVYSCSWPFYMVKKGVFPNHTAIAEVCNLWRNYRDIQDKWPAVVDIANYYGDHQNVLTPFHGPGHWNDAGMLIIGNDALNYEQAKAHMALWCVMGVPLFVSTDLMKIRPELKAILLNEMAISIDQDPLGKMGRRISNDRGIQVWRKPILPRISNYFSYAFVMVNFRSSNSREIVKTAAQLGLYYPNGYLLEDVFVPGTCDVFDLAQNVFATIPPNGAVFWKFTVIRPIKRVKSKQSFSNPCDDREKSSIKLTSWI